MSFYDSLVNAPIVRPEIPEPAPRPTSMRKASKGRPKSDTPIVIQTPVVYEKYIEGQSLIVTDCFGKKWPCQYVGMDGKQAIFSINGGKMACDPSQLSKRVTSSK